MSSSAPGQRPAAYERVIGGPAADLHAFVVIDEFVNGSGTGGIRFTEEVTLDEVARLAREMTLKSAWLRLPSGGAKAGIVARPGLTRDCRESICKQFGAAIRDLVETGRYVGGMDLGTNTGDLSIIMAAAGRDIDSAPSDPTIDSNYFTALTVFLSAKALLGLRRRSPEPPTALVEGLGKVGTQILGMLGSDGMRVLGVSTLAGSIYDPAGIDIARLLELQSRYGDECVHHVPGLSVEAPETLFLKEADLLIPGGASDSLNGDNIADIKARHIVPIANVSANEAIEEALHRRGIDYVPGFVSNSGGIFCWYLSGLTPEGREDILRSGFQAKVERLIHQSDRSGRSIARTAREQAEKNLRSLKRAEKGGLSAQLLDGLKKLSPERLGYVVGRKLLGAEWAARSHRTTRRYFDARYFR